MMDLMFLLVVIAAVICIAAYVAKKIFLHVMNIDDYMEDYEEEEEEKYESGDR